MNKNTINKKGLTLIELMVTVLISAVVLAAVVEAFAFASKVTRDHNIRLAANLEAQGVIDTMLPEIRMLGNGVPFYQEHFQIAQDAMTDNTVTEPILASGTTATQLRVRLNQTGNIFIVTTNYNPAVSSTVTLFSVTGISVGDIAYMSNATVADDDGFYGVVSAVNTATNVVTFASGYQYSNDTATFNAGSIFEIVPTITYTSTASFGGITRNDGSGAVALSASGEFTLEYMNESNAAITLPLVASRADPLPASAIQNVKYIRITVQVRSLKQLSTGAYYTATLLQDVGVRNLKYKY